MYIFHCCLFTIVRFLLGNTLLNDKFFFSVYKEAQDLAREYSKTKGPGTQAKPEQHPFFKRLAPIVQRTLEKCERENGMM